MTVYRNATAAPEKSNTIMSRSTRSRRAAVAPLKSETDVKTSAVSTKKASHVKNSKVRSIRKKVEQDENILPRVKNSKASNGKNAPSKTILGSKLHLAKKDNISTRKNTVLAIKSPALRDRTNTTNEFIKDDFSPKKSSEILLKENKRSMQRQETKKSKKTSTKKSGELQLEVSLEKYDIGTNIVQKNLRTSNSEEKEKKILNKGGARKRTDKTNLKGKSDFQIQNVKESVSNIDTNDNEKGIAIISDAKLESQNSNNVQNKRPKRRNMSDKDIKDLLDKDNEADEIHSDKENIKLNGINEIRMESDRKDKQEENQKPVKKFFKNKSLQEEMKTKVAPKRNTRRQAVNRKKIQHDDSTFSPKLEEEKQSNKLREKKLRPRTVKNYCEVSKLSQDSNSVETNAASKESSVTEKDKKGPIYKDVKLSQENVKDKEKIYNFPDDSQESEPKGKKRKKVTKKPSAKRNKKGTTSKGVTIEKTQKKTAKEVPHVMQYKEQNEQPINLQQTVVINNIQTNIFIPEHLQDAGDSTIADAPTIKIISDHKLEGSDRINLTATPPVPKTISSELKLFGPRNVITSQPTKKYSNMINHSLIRQSMSPITKLVDNFDTGSPWRADEAFSRVQRVVQSTPQINRLPSMRERKVQVPMMKLNEKSLSSEDTIHISSTFDNKPSSNLKNAEIITQQKEKEISPRKFGTVISNLSPAKSTTIENANNSKSPINHLTTVTNNQHPSTPILPGHEKSPEVSINQNEILVINIADNKENTLPSSKKSPKKKFSTPSPFRFEKIRSSKRIAMQSVLAFNESQSKISQSNSQKENENPEQEAGPSWLDNPKPTAVLRQSNLNNFLNLDEMPESTCISTNHGIFSDPHSTPINGKKPKKLIEEPNVENAFGFDDCYLDEVSPVSKPTPIIATAKDVKNSKKGKLFPNARVKSALISRVTENVEKKPDVKNVLEKAAEDKVPAISNETEKSVTNKEKDKIKKDMENNDNSEDPKKTVLDAVSFSDTFDVLSENGEIEQKAPEEVPLFVDLEPLHFTQPPRRSYCKRKRGVRFDTSKDDFDSDEDESEKPKHKKKKESHLNKQEEKRMQEWVQNVNKTFDEIDHFDLVVE